MRAVIAVLAYLAYLTLGTYAVPELRIDLGTGSAVPYAVPLAAGLAVFGFLEFAVRSGVGNQDERILAKWTAIYVCATVVSLVGAINVDTESTVKHLLMATFPLILTLSRPGAALCRRCLWLLGVSSLAVLMYGVYGYMTGSFGDAAEHAFGYLGVTYKTSTRNGDSLYFQTLLWVALGAAMSSRTRPWLRVTLFAVALGSVVAVILSLSRGAWIAVAFTPAVLYVAARKSAGGMRSAFLVVLCLGAAVLLSIVFSEAVQQLVGQRASSLMTMSEEGGNSNAARATIIQGVLPIIGGHPLFGVGYANLRYYFPQAVGLDINHAENTYLQVLGEQGLFAFISFLGLLAWCVKGLLRLVSVMSFGDRRQDWAAVVLLALVVDFAVFSLFNNVLDDMWFWNVLALAALYVCSKPAAMASRRLVGSRRSLLPRGVVLSPASHNSIYRVSEPSVSSVDSCG